MSNNGRKNLLNHQGACVCVCVQVCGCVSVWVCECVGKTAFWLDWWSTSLVGNENERYKTCWFTYIIMWIEMNQLNSSGAHNAARIGLDPIASFRVKVAAMTAPPLPIPGTVRGIPGASMWIPWVRPTVNRWINGRLWWFRWLNLLTRFTPYLMMAHRARPTRIEPSNIMYNGLIYSDQFHERQFQFSWLLIASSLIHLSALTFISQQIHYRPTANVCHNWWPPRLDWTQMLVVSFPQTKSWSRYRFSNRPGMDDWSLMA